MLRAKNRPIWSQISSLSSQVSEVVVDVRAAVGPTEEVAGPLTTKNCSGDLVSSLVEYPEELRLCTGRSKDWEFDLDSLSRSSPPCTDDSSSRMAFQSCLIWPRRCATSSWSSTTTPSRAWSRRINTACTVIFPSCAAVQAAQSQSPAQPTSARTT